jgi:hypothetical protein
MAEKLHTIKAAAIEIFNPPLSINGPKIWLAI